MKSEHDMDESLEREGYEHSNSLSNCQNCGAQMVDQTEGDYTRVVCPVCKTVERESYPL